MNEIDNVHNLSNDEQFDEQANEQANSTSVPINNRSGVKDLNGI